MKVKGQITVFLSMTIMCICGLMFGILESARLEGIRCYLQTAVHSSMDSLFSGYHRDIWNQYRILVREYRTEEELKDEFEKYLTTYKDAAGWYAMDIKKTDLEEISHITDHGGRNLEKQVLDYMKFGVWNLNFQEDTAEDLKKELKEAAATKRIADQYSKETGQAVKLEKAVERLDQCLERQKELYKEAQNSLEDLDGSGFLDRGKKLLKELKKIPDLVDNYEEKADELRRELEESRQYYIAESKDLTSSSKSMLEAEIGKYDSYIMEEGERRKEIAGLKSIAEQNMDLVEAVMEEAEAVEQYISEWEGEDEEDELDEEALWRPVQRHFERFKQAELLCAHGTADKEKQSFLEQTKGLLEKGLLSVVIPEGKEVSQAVLPNSSFPSSIYEETEGEYTSLINNLIVNEYCGMVFSDFLDEEKEVQYELEYLIGGKLTDRENLSIAVGDIFLIREGLNFLHILSDKEKRQAAVQLAEVIVGASGLAPLVPIMAFLIMNIWASAEAAYDIKSLLSGEKIPLIKTAEDWKLGVEQILDIGKNSKLDSNPYGREGRGLGYEEYLKLMLFLKNSSQKYYRMMDVIQMNIQRKQPGFSIKQCACYIHIKADICGKHLFLRLPFVENKKETGGYQMEAEAEKAY